MEMRARLGVLIFIALLTLLTTTTTGCFGVTEPPKVVTVPVGSATPAPLVMMTAPPPVREEGALVPSRDQLPTGEEAIGSPAPGFALKPVVQGATSAELRYGKVTIIHFWATWCSPCMKSLPALEELSSHYRARGVEVIGVSVDDEVAGVADFTKRFKVQYPVAWDPGHQVTKLYQPASMPSTFVIDRAAVVRFLHQGYHEGEVDELEEEIKQLL
jgi:peroxiredoxin